MPASSVHMNPLPITTAARKALVTSGLKARQIAVSRNPAPRRIGIVGPTIFANGNAAIIRGTGAIAHIFELGREGGYIITPGLRQGSRTRRSSRISGSEVTGRTFFVGPSSQAARRGKTGTSVDAIRFTKGDGRFYRGIGFKGGAMRAKPFIRPTLQPWVSMYNYELSRGLASVGTAELSKIGRITGLI